MGIGLNLYCHENSDFLPPSYMAYYTSPTNYYLQYWCDRMCAYFDPNAVPPTLGAMWSVGYIRPDDVWTWNYYGVTISLSRVMDCPSQPSEWDGQGAAKGKLVWNELYGWNDTWGQRPASIPPHKVSIADRMMFYKSPSRYCQMLDKGKDFWYSLGWNPSDGNHDTAIGTGAPHRKTTNAMFLDGHVEFFTTTFMANYYPQLYGQVAYPFRVPDK